MDIKMLAKAPTVLHMMCWELEFPELTTRCLFYLSVKHLLYLNAWFLKSILESCSSKFRFSKSGVGCSIFKVGSQGVFLCSLIWKLLCKAFLVWGAYFMYAKHLLTQFHKPSFIVFIQSQIRSKPLMNSTFCLLNLLETSI